MRQTMDEIMLRVAAALASRAACVKRQVGCVLTTADGRIVGTGYNGRARGQPNCDGDKPCPGIECQGVHAEVNALLQASARDVITCYVTTFPCWHCVKTLLNTGIKTIVTPQSIFDKNQDRALQLWLNVNRDYRRVR